MSLKAPKTVEITMVELTPKGALVHFDSNPSHVWKLLIGARSYKKAPKCLLFPNKYSMDAVIAQMHRWPYLRKPVFLYDNVYASVPISMKYNMNTYPHNWVRITGMKKLPSTGLSMEKDIDLTKRSGTKNLDKIKRSTLKSIKRTPDYTV